MQSLATTELLRAVHAGDAKNIEAWALQGADVEASDSDGSTPLIVAVARREPDCVRALLAAHANPNATDSAFWTPLIHAAYASSNPASNDFACAELLLAAGARPEKKTLDGLDALAVARQEGSPGFASALGAYLDASRARAELDRDIARAPSSPKTRV